MSFICKKERKKGHRPTCFVSQTLLFFLISFTEFGQIFNNQSLKSTPAQKIRITSSIFYHGFGDFWKIIFDAFFVVDHLQLKGCANLLFSPFCPINCKNFKKFGPRGDTRPSEYEVHQQNQIAQKFLLYNQKKTLLSVFALSIKFCL